ncbi:Eco57I restriction-modification methylase domain-containing protein [Capnocytophaga canimorsus]|uniref:Eco57I restriction-modification methylase domain-containing protein n=1 Tax=Capnocytophaga canimorsus TaxID=28188 RepID=UPI0028E48854|nr:Eco57I restriction-modification methylase domain-containing protein [Capnocytophaga canimorsus]MDT9498436.1 Eco57I restriction-modification methylase domain-containing protein [Capnocytophaga canimorsus]
MNYNPDVLTCLANLSNDEVFTPPDIANQMLDTLPQELFSNPDAKFLDPFSKSGVFLREIAKRLLKGLQPQIPDLQERIDHIMHRQLYGIGITELTAYLSRRSLYCSTRANGKHSVTHFENENGNIYFKELPHSWDKNGKCTYCGATQKEFGEDQREGLSQHAYNFIHNDNPYQNMQFDVIIGNPPYQLSFGLEGTNSSNAGAIYHLFIEQAIKLNPHYLCMIVPSRWMTRSVQGMPNSFIDNMLSSNRFVEIHDFLNAKGVFTGTPPEGGVNYFLWDRDYQGECNYYLYQSGDDKNPFYEKKFLSRNGLNIVIRDAQASKILDKIIKVEKDYITDNNFSEIVSPKHFFDNSIFLTSNWNGFTTTPNKDYNIKYYPNKTLLKDDAEYGWINVNQIPKNREVKDLHKVYIPAAHGGKEKVLGTPFYGEPNSVCSQTYLVIGYNRNFTKEECLNIITYIKTCFFRYLVSIKKKTQNGARGVYQFVPMQDFSKPWTDAELYAKYRLTEEEITYIEKTIRPME